ncbi:hypothetical protein [Piscinibacter terrae]|uniref:Uncharacterized protein n=1 Tax=Piscinibacter terrae TaxID=2496871 RepID=A0A3N7HL34_9BURK|nr:hypothetical protein [Albitalea terrae]RQP22814.1 hypothetical protein DZC73_21215 [Albitalea terrae]
MNQTPPAPATVPKPPEKHPAPGPVDPARESVAGEEDPGAAVEDAGDEAFNHLPPGLDHPA